MADHEKPFLNTLRWTSAFLVMAGHALGWTYQVDLTTLAAAKYVLDLGHAAVIIFFVVSGYLVGGGVFARADGFRWGPYASARIARIYAVLVPALVLTVGLDGWAWLSDPHNPIYDAVWGRIADPVFKSYRPANIAASLLSLESVIGAPIGSDKPLWSLGFEWVFYFVCPLALIAIRRVSPSVLIRIGLCAALAVVMFALHQRWMASYWLIWLAGAAASRIQLGRWPAIALLAVGLAALFASPFIDERLTDPIEGFGLAGFLAWPGAMRFRLNLRLDHVLADLSYSLYVVHMPVLTFIVFTLWRLQLFPLARYPSYGAGVLTWLGLIAASLATAYVFSVLFERRTDVLKGWLTRRLAVFGSSGKSGPTTETV